MRSQLLRVLQAGRIAAAVQELGAASGIAPCALQALASRNPQVPGADASAKAGRGAPERLPAFSSAASGRFISTSASASAEALTATPVEGDVAALIKELDSVLSSEACTAKEVADAAVSLAYLQAKGNRRIWGKVFEKASALKGSFDATSLANFLWATSAASVDHFKTVYELAGPAAGFTKSFSAKQLSFVVEALGRAGVNDAELFAGLAGAVQAKMGELSPADLCRVLYGMAASGVPDVATAKAVATAVVGKADGLAVTQLAQLSWALAEARIADRPLLDGVARALKAKLPAVESAQEAAAIALAMGSLGVSDPELASKAAAAVKASAPGLTTPQMVHAAWGLSTLGSTDKEAFSTLFKGISAGMDAKLDAVDVKTAAMLHEAAVLVAASIKGGDAPKLSDKASAYAAKVYGLQAAHGRMFAPQSMVEFKADLAEHVARSMGARYRPEIAAAMKNFARSLPDGVAVDIGVDADGVKVALEAAGGDSISTARTLVGPQVAKKKLLEAAGYKVVVVPQPVWAGLASGKDKCQWLLDAVKAAAPAMAGRVAALQKKLDEPFNPYAE